MGSGEERRPLCFRALCFRMGGGEEKKKKKKGWVKVLAQRVVVVVKLFMTLGEESREWKKLLTTPLLTKYNLKVGEI